MHARVYAQFIKLLLCVCKNMIFISTPFSQAALKRIIDFDLPAIKNKAPA